MTAPIAITRKNYWQVNGNNHATAEEAFEDAVNQALAAAGSVVQVQPPAYVVTYTAAVTPPVSPPPPPPPVDPPVTPPASGDTPYIGAFQPGDVVKLPEA